MIVGTLEVSLRMDGCHSLKEKRSVIKPILEKARRRFAVTAAEIEDLDLWNSSVLGFAIVSNDPKLAESIMSRVLEDIENSGNAAVQASLFELIRTN